MYDVGMAAGVVGWGILGLGKLADIAVAPVIAAGQHSELVAVCSRARGRAEEFASRHGDASGYDAYPAMLADPRVQAVYVATPNGLHAEHALAAVRAGRHVLVEKPMTLTSAEASDLVAAAAAADVRLGVGLHLRHKVTNRCAREAIAAGAIGPPSLVDIPFGAGQDVYPYHTWRSDPALAGGGTLLNQGAHAVDMLEFLTGQPIVEVSATVDRSPLEDVLVATCRLDGGVLATLSSHQVRPGTRRDWVVVGRSGWLEGRGALAAPAGDQLVLHDGASARVLAVSERSAYAEEVDAFSRAVLGAVPVDGDGDDGLRNVAVIEALYRSAREGRRVAVVTGGQRAPSRTTLS